MHAPCLAALLAVALAVPLAPAPAAASALPAEQPDGGHNACAVNVNVAAPTPVNGLNCGKVSELSASSSCWSEPGGLSCYASLYGRADAYQWVGGGELSAALTGYCQSAGLRTWSAVEGGFFPFVYVYGPSLYCSGPAVFIPAGSCHTLTATLAASYRGAPAPPDVAQTLDLELCA